MVNCKQCNSLSVVKNGIVRKKQRFICKECGYNFVIGDSRKDKNLDKQRMALHLYLENMGFRAIGRVLGVSNVAVLNWIKSSGKEIKEYHQEQEFEDKVKVMEFDEMWHFIGSKKESYGFGLHWTEQGSVFLTLLPEAERFQQVKSCGTKSKI